MASKLYELGLRLTAKLDGSLHKAFGTAGKALKSYDQAVDALRQHQSNLDRVMKQRQATDKAQKAFAAAQRTVKALALEMKAAQHPSAQLKAQFQKAQAAVSSTSAALQKQTALLKKLHASSGMAGKSLQQLKQRELELQHAADRAAAAQQRQQRLQGATQKLQGAYGKMSGAYASAAGAVAMGYAITQALKPGMDLEKQMSQLSATTGMTAEQLAEVEERATLLGRDTVLSADQAARGIQLFVRAGNDLDSSAAAMEHMGHLAVMTGMDFADASQFALETMKSFGLTAKDAGRVSDVLANATRDSGLSAEQMAEKLASVGPTLHALGLSLEESAGMAVAMDKMGLDAEKLKKTLTVLKAPTEAQAKALNKLGVSGVNADGSAKSMTEIIATLNDRIKDMPEAMQNAQLTQIFGSRDFVTARALMDNMANGTLPNLIDKMGQAGTAAAMADKTTDNLAGDFQGLASAVSYTAIRVFKVLQPALRKVVKVISNVISKVGDFLHDNPKVAAAIGAVVVGIGALLTAMLALKAGAAVVGLVTAALKILNLTMLASPIGIVIGLIAGLIAAGYMLYKHWDEVKAWLGSLWQAFANKCPGMAKFLTDAWNTAVDTIKKVWDNLKVIFDGIIEFICGVFTGDWDRAWKGLTKVTEGFEGIFKAVWDGVKSVFHGFMTWFAGLFGVEWQNVWKSITSFMDEIGLFQSIEALWGNIKGVFNGIINFVKNVFTGNWSGAWQAITDVFGNIFGGIVNLAKVPINAVIKAINWVLESINEMSIEIPDWVPGLGGEKLGFNLSTIPLLASGGVATAPTLAMVGEGAESEAILPLSRLESMLSGGATAHTNDVSIVFSPTINISGGQGSEVQALNEALRVSSEQIRREIDEYFRQKQRATYG